MVNKSLRIVGPNGVVADRVSFCNTFYSRFRGLRGRSHLQAGEALVLDPCRQVHTFGLPFSIDAVFRDNNETVVHVQTLTPRRISRFVRDARTCIELPDGQASRCGLEVGVNLVLERTA